MENKLMMPACYNALDEEELTYTSGGSEIGDFFGALGVPAVVLSVISVANLVWAVSNTRSWIQKNKSTNSSTLENVATLIVDGIDDTVSYASKSVWNAVVTVYSAQNLTVWWPVTAIAWLTA